MTYDETIRHLEFIAGDGSDERAVNINVERDSLRNFVQEVKEALENQNADSCEGCKYMAKDIYEMPCLVCKRSKEDMWRNVND